MTRFHPAFAILVVALNWGAIALAQVYTPPLADAPPGPDQDDTRDGLGLIERGMGQLLDNFMRDAEPELDAIGDGLAETLARIGPMLKDLTRLVDDLDNYQAPDRLANGDIIIRRDPDAPPPPALGDDGAESPNADEQIPRDLPGPEIEL